MKKKLDILEVLSGTGIRSIRYMKEISSLNKLIANDIDPTAVDLIKKNFVFLWYEAQDFCLKNFLNFG